MYLSIRKQFHRDLCPGTRHTLGLPPLRKVHGIHCELPLHMKKTSDAFLLVALELELELAEQPVLGLQSLKPSEVRLHPLQLHNLQL